VLFGVCAAAVWGLLPLIARHSGAGGAGGFGALVACLGAGAVLAVFMAPRLRRQFGVDRVSHWSGIAFALMTLGAAFIRSTPVLCAMMVVAGIGWSLTLNSLNAVMQSVLPPWVRARCLALYMLLVQGSMAIGSLLWGAVAQASGVREALAAAAVTMAIGAVAARWRFKLYTGVEADITQVEQWDMPLTGEQPDLDDGPVLVQIEYCIQPLRSAEFVAAAKELGRTRRRDGAMFWRLYRDIGEPGRYRERFTVDSWAEYLRTRARRTVADRLAEEQLQLFHQGDEPVRVSHSIAER